MVSDVLSVPSRSEDRLRDELSNALHEALKERNLLEPSSLARELSVSEIGAMRLLHMARVPVEIALRVSDALNLQLRVEVGPAVTRG